MYTAPRAFWSDPGKTAMERLAYRDGVTVSLQCCSSACQDTCRVGIVASMMTTIQQWRSLSSSSNWQISICSRYPSAGCVLHQICVA